MLELWKALSVVLAGTFGILGLLTEFRDTVSKKVTRWGYVMLAGIVISTAGGTAAQVFEAKASAKASEENARATRMLANQTRLALENSTHSVTQMDRLLHAIGRPTLEVRFQIDCQVSRVNRQRCLSLERQSNAPTGTLVKGLPSAWTRRPVFAAHMSGKADYHYLAHYRGVAEPLKVEDIEGGSLLTILVFHAPMVTVINDMDLQGAGDLCKVDVEFYVPADLAREMTLIGVDLISQSGQPIPGGDPKRIAVDDETATYTAEFCGEN